MVGQLRLSGRVVDEDHLGLPLVQMTIDSISLRTNMEGAYSVDVAKGVHRIHIQFTGYQDVDTLVLVKKSVEQVFRMTPFVQELEVANITYNLAKEKAETGYALTSISTKELQAQSLEINEVLTRSSGLSVRSGGGLGSRSTISINGLGGRAVRFFLDGVPMDYFGSSFSINTIPISIIDRVDVYKGVIPAELGSDALGGAINLSTKKLQKNQLELSYSMGSFNTHRLNIYGHYRDSVSGFTADAFAFYNYSANNYEVWGDDIHVTNPETFMIDRDVRVKRFHDAFRSAAAKINLGYTDKKWADQFYLGFLASGMDKEIQHGSTMQTVYGEAKYQQQVFMPHLVYKKMNIVKNLDVNLFASYSLLNRQRIDTSRNIYNWYGDIEGQRTLGGEQTRTLNELDEKASLLRLNAIYYLHKHHRLVFNNVMSLLKRDENDPILTNKNDGYWSPQYYNKNILGVSLKGEFEKYKVDYSVFAKSFSYAAQVKTSYYDQGTMYFEPSSSENNQFGTGMALSYHFSAFGSLLFSVEKTARLPESDEILGDGLSTVYSDSLRPEQSKNINLGAVLRFREKKDLKITSTSNFFYRDVTDLIQAYQYDNNTFINMNFEKVRMTGVDASVKLKYKTKLEYMVSLSLLNPILKTKTNQLGEAKINYNTRMPNMPFVNHSQTLKYTLHDVFKKTNRLSFYWNLYYVGEFHRYSEIIGKYNKDKIPQQLINSCGVSYLMLKQKLSIGFDAKNLFDEQAFDNYAVQKPGRSMFAKVTYIFN